MRGLAGTTFSTADLVGLRPRAAGLSLDASLSSRVGRSGIRVSRIRGRGMEYSESRIYLPGDDIRRIDWRVTARTGRPHTKLFHEERDRPVLFVVDLGAHMRFGTRGAFKSVVAAEAASLLAWAAAENGDRVGGLVPGGGLRPSPASWVGDAVRSGCFERLPEPGSRRMHGPTAADSRMRSLVRSGWPGPERW